MDPPTDPGIGRFPLLVRVYALSSWAARIPSRLAGSLFRLHETIWQEILWRWTRPEDRAAANLAIYRSLRVYFPGGANFVLGLFDWEKRAILNPAFPARGRILLGGAGAGRELSGLLKLGYDVLAFDPVPEFCDAARKVAAPYPGSAVVRASYRDLVEALLRGGGPLASCMADRQPFDAVIFGAASYGYLGGPRDRQELLAAVRAAAPKAPLLVSFVFHKPTGSRIERLGRRVGGFCRRLGAPSNRQPGDFFRPDTGFEHFLSEEELQTDLREAGYRALYIEWNAISHTLLLPQ